MNLYIIGINHKTAPIFIREKFSVEAQEQKDILSKIKLLPGIAECALLSTCNRTELHIYSESKITDTGYIEEYFCSLKGLEIYNVKKYFNIYEGVNAIKHVINVASGMDSLILGEDQILHQFKKAYELSQENGTSKSVLNTLSRLAITASKKIKTRSLLVGKASNVAGQVLELLEDFYESNISNIKILIIGSGEIGTMVCKELLQNRALGIIMTKRSKNSEQAFDNNSKVIFVNYADRYSYIEDSDVIISATSSPHYTITRDILDESIVNRDRKRIFIDLAVPRDLDDTITKIKNVLLYNIDDLKGFTGNKRKGSQLDLQFINEQVESYTEEFIRWFKYKNSVSLNGEV